MKRRTPLVSEERPPSNGGTAVLLLPFLTRARLPVSLRHVAIPTQRLEPSRVAVASEPHIERLFLVTSPPVSSGNYVVDCEERLIVLTAAGTPVSVVCECRVLQLSPALSGLCKHRSLVAAVVRLSGEPVGFRCWARQLLLRFGNSGGDCRCYLLDGAASDIASHANAKQLPHIGRDRYGGGTE